MNRDNSKDRSVNEIPGQVCLDEYDEQVTRESKAIRKSFKSTRGMPNHRVNPYGQNIDTPEGDVK